MEQREEERVSEEVGKQLTRGWVRWREVERTGDQVRGPRPHTAHLL